MSRAIRPTSWAYHIQCRGNWIRVAKYASVRAISSAAPRQEAGVQQQSFQGPTVVLKQGKARLFKDGHPLVYGGAVDHLTGAPKTGDAVLVTDNRANTIGWGFFNSTSMFRVRVMQLREEFQALQSLDAAPAKIIGQRIAAAFTLRQAFEPAKEGDRLSGLVVDVYGSHVVVASSAAWVEQHKDMLQETLTKLPGISSLSWKPSVSMLNEEGVILPPLEQPPADAENEDADPDASTSAAVLENGIAFKVPLVGGQKTGFYADQRDSRLYIRRLAKGKRVLDLCCYTGGFAVSAAVGGAQHVTGVDSSNSAVQLAAENADLNKISSDCCSFEARSIEDYMRSAHDAGQKWDLVVLDPPKLAPNRKSLQRAMGKYQRLNTAAMQLVRPGGLLMTCSCSGAMTQSDEFLPMLQAAAGRAGRKIVVLRYAGASPDHPLNPSYPEGEYLTNVLLNVK